MVICLPCEGLLVEDFELFTEGRSSSEIEEAWSQNYIGTEASTVSAGVPIEPHGDSHRPSIHTKLKSMNRNRS